MAASISTACLAFIVFLVHSTLFLNVSSSVSNTSTNSSAPPTSNTSVVASTTTILTVSSTSTADTSVVTPTTAILTVPTTSTAGTTAPPSTQIWNKVVGEMLGDQISFIIIIAALGLCLILLIALIVTCCRYRKLKKNTQFPKDLIINNDSTWINSHDDLVMWERNLRATEISPNNSAPPTNPANEKRQ